MTDIRPDSYVLLLNRIKGEVRQKIGCAERFLELLNAIKIDPNYSTAATEIEKSNYDMLIPMIQEMIKTLKAIVWE